MRSFIAYGNSDPDSRRSGPRSSHAQGAGRERRCVAVRVPARRARACGGSTDARGASCPPALAQAGPVVGEQRRRAASRPRPAGVIVVDASAVLDGLLDATDHPQVALVLSGAMDPLAAPDLLDVEVLSVLRRWEQRGEVTSARARLAFDDLEALPVVRYSSRALANVAWSMRKTLTAYDAQYVALAKLLPGRLLTTDLRMAKAARQLKVVVA